MSIAAFKGVPLMAKFAFSTPLLTATHSTAPQQEALLGSCESNMVKACTQFAACRCRAQAEASTHSQPGTDGMDDGRTQGCDDFNCFFRALSSVPGVLSGLHLPVKFYAAGANSATAMRRQLAARIASAGARDMHLRKLLAGALRAHARKLSTGALAACLTRMAALLGALAAAKSRGCQRTRRMLALTACKRLKKELPKAILRGDSALCGLLMEFCTLHLGLQTFSNGQDRIVDVAFAQQHVLDGPQVPLEMRWPQWARSRRAALHKIKAMATSGPPDTLGPVMARLLLQRYTLPDGTAVAHAAPALDTQAPQSSTLQPGMLQRLLEQAKQRQARISTCRAQRTLLQVTGGNVWLDLLAGGDPQPACVRRSQEQVRAWQVYWSVVFISTS